MTRAWIRRSQTDPKAVLLRELHPSVFAFMDYNPQVTARGEHILRFLTRAGEFPFSTLVRIDANIGRCGCVFA